MGPELNTSLARMSRGFTMIELLVVMVVMAILASLAMPNFGAMMASNRVRGAASELAAEISAARFEAIKQHRRVVVERTGTTWKDGWRLYVDTNGNSTLDGGEQVIKVSQALSDSTLKICTLGTDFANAIVFRGDGTVQNATIGSEPGLRVVDDRGTGTVSASRNVVLSPAGRVSVQVLRDGTGGVCP